VISFVPDEILDARNSAPRPLKERIGFAVSTFATIFAPKIRDNESASYCGVFRNTGSISRTAARILSIFRR
jgi:hypothetical protein